MAAERGHDVCVNFRANEAAAGAVVAEHAPFSGCSRYEASYTTGTFIDVAGGR
jgi:hypothetical protein